MDSPGKAGEIRYNTIVDITKDVKDVLSLIVNYFLKTGKTKNIDKILEPFGNQLLEKLAKKLTFNLTNEIKSALTLEITFKPKNGICIKDVIPGDLTLGDIGNLESSLGNVDKNKIFGLLNNLIEGVNVRLYIDDKLAKSTTAEELALRNKGVTKANTIYSSFHGELNAEEVSKILKIVFGEEIGNDLEALMKEGMALEERKVKGEVITADEANRFKLNSSKIMRSFNSTPFIGGVAGGIGLIINHNLKYVVYKC